MANPSSNDERPVRGLVVDSTPQGMTKKQFKDLLATANTLHADGLMLAGVVQLEGAKVGALFVRVRPPSTQQPARPAAEPSSLVNEEDLVNPWGT